MRQERLLERLLRAGLGTGYLTMLFTWDGMQDMSVHLPEAPAPITMTRGYPCVAASTSVSLLLTPCCSNKEPARPTLLCRWERTSPGCWGKRFPASSALPLDESLESRCL